MKFGLTDRLTNWLTDRPPDCPPTRLTDLPTNWLTDSLTHWLTDWLTDSLTDSLTHWLTDTLTHWLSHWLAHWLTDTLMHWLSDSLTERQTDIDTWTDKQTDRQTDRLRLLHINWRAACRCVDRMSLFWHMKRKGLVLMEPQKLTLVKNAGSDYSFFLSIRSQHHEEERSYFDSGWVGQRIWLQRCRRCVGIIKGAFL